MALELFTSEVLIVRSLHPLRLPRKEIFAEKAICSFRLFILQIVRSVGEEPRNRVGGHTKDIGKIIHFFEILCTENSQN